jgi:hypothetical protein
MPTTPTFSVGGQHGSLPLVLAKARALALAGHAAAVRGPGGAASVTWTGEAFEVEPATLFTPDWLHRARTILADHGGTPTCQP